MAADVRVVSRDHFGTASLTAFLELMAPFASPVVGLATGNTPGPFYASLHREVGHGRASLADPRPFAIDEYVGRADHPCSNREFFARHWDTIPGAPAVHQFEVTATDLAAEAVRFAALLEAAGGLDVVVLGIGLNGHLAFNEPGSASDSVSRLTALTETTRESARPCWGDATPTHGLTLGLAEILEARRALLLVNGAAKAAVLHRALAGPVSSECPASFLQEHPALTVVADDAAAACWVQSSREASD